MRKNLFSLKILGLALGIFFVTSCSDDETCADCHMVVMNADGSETELMDLGEYCESALSDIEQNGYTFLDTIFVDSDGDTLSSPVAPGDPTEVHCGEEHDHDDHDH